MTHPHGSQVESAAYQFPPLTLLAGDRAATFPSELRDEGATLTDRQARLTKALATYGVPANDLTATVGPRLTCFELLPVPGVKVARLLGLEADLQLALGVPGLRVRVLPHRGTVGIDWPHTHPERVRLRPILTEAGAADSVVALALPVVIGAADDWQVTVAELTDMPHLLLTGAQGMGKSVAVHALLLTLLYRCHPARVKLVLIDPIGAELSRYELLQHHFLAALPGAVHGVVTTPAAASATLRALGELTRNRHALLQAAGCHSLTEYATLRAADHSAGSQEPLPLIVVVLEEVEELLRITESNFADSLDYLLRHGRLVGIHLIVSAIQLGNHALPPALASNLTARLIFRPPLRPIRADDALADAGHLAPGELLYRRGIEQQLLLSPYVDTAEIQAVCEHIRAQPLPTPWALPPDPAAPEADVEAWDQDEDDEPDALLFEAARVVVTHQQGSTSLLQRRLKLGYNRSGRLIDQLEKIGVVGPFEGSKSRDVLIPDEYALEVLLRSITQARDAGKPWVPADRPVPSRHAPAAVPPPLPTSPVLPAPQPAISRTSAIVPPVSQPAPVSLATARPDGSATRPSGPAKRPDSPPAPPTSRPAYPAYTAQAILFILGIVCLVTLGRQLFVSESTAPALPAAAAITGQQSRILSRTGMNLRARPEAVAPVVVAVPYYVNVDVLRTDGPQQVIGQHQAAWYQVAYQGQTGWLWGGYVEMLP